MLKLQEVQELLNQVLSPRAVLLKEQPYESKAFCLFCDCVLSAFPLPLRCFHCLGGTDEFPSTREGINEAFMQHRVTGYLSEKILHHTGVLVWTDSVQNKLS